MPFFSLRWSTSIQACSPASLSAISPVRSGEPSSTTSTRKEPAGPSSPEQAPARTSPAAATIASSLKVGRISHGSPDTRRTLAGAYAEAMALRSSSNAAIADALEELGDLYELDGAIVHRVTAYRTAAKAVREATVSVADLARAGRATDLPGVGSTLQEKILALVSTGSIPAAEKLRKKFPEGLVAITRLPGLGPKRARLLHAELGIDSPQKLRDAALQQRLRTVRGLGARFEANVLSALEEGIPPTRE